ncbi:hypothetical protein NL676_001026 [Syzygium grande]|nr:hypothetical protein NL676_001026 [Syzygium grande]
MVVLGQLVVTAIIAAMVEVGPAAEAAVLARVVAAANFKCSVFRVLLSKGLVHTHSLAPSLIVPERRFLEEFVTRYLGEAPQLLDLYKEKMGLAS